MREFAPKKLVKHVSKHSRPQLFTITKPADFQTKCLKRRYCVAFALGINGGGNSNKKKKRKIKPPTLNSNQKKVINKLVRKHRNVGFVFVDTSKWELEVLGENIQGFQKKIDDISTVNYPSVVAFRRDVNDTTSGKGRFRHLNKEIKEGTSAISMSLCRHLIHSNTTKEEARRIFKEHKISFKSFKEKPVSLLRHKNALYRINKKYFTWKTAASYIASEMLFKQPLPSSIMEKIDNHTAKEDKAARKKARTHVHVTSSKKYDHDAYSNSKKKKDRFFSESALDKFVKSIPKDEEFVMAENNGISIKKFLSVAEKTKMEEGKKRKKMQNLQKRRKRAKAAEKKSETLKKRMERKSRRKNRRNGNGSTKEELQKEQQRRERERREQMDREMEKFGATAADDDDRDEENDDDDSEIATENDDDADDVSYHVDSDGESFEMMDDEDGDENDDNEVLDLGDLEDDEDDDADM